MLLRVLYRIVVHPLRKKSPVIRKAQLLEKPIYLEKHEPRGSNDPFLFEDGRVWEDLPEVAVRRHLPAAVHLLEGLGVAAVLGVARGRGAPALCGRLEELLAEAVVQ